MRHTFDLDYILKAVVGIASPLVGVITSLQEQIEWTLRVSSLVVGLLVGLMSLVGMIRKMRGKP
jgi:hypothetical protein